MADRTTIEPSTRFGRLTTVTQMRKLDRPAWLCECDCGRECVVRSKSLRSGDTSSCGCLRAEQLGNRRRRHGQSKGATTPAAPEYTAWTRMQTRCGSPNNPVFKNYGGRGIRVCDEWQGDGGFERFLAHIGPRPSSKHSIDRINNDGNYEPGNVRWATITEQQQNRRSNRNVIVNGERVCVAEMARRLGVSPGTIKNRLARGESIAGGAL